MVILQKVTRSRLICSWYLYREKGYQKATFYEYTFGMCKRVCQKLTLCGSNLTKVYQKLTCYTNLKKMLPEVNFFCIQHARCKKGYQKLTFCHKWRSRSFVASHCTTSTSVATRHRADRSVKTKGSTAWESLGGSVNTAVTYLAMCTGSHLESWTILLTKKPLLLTKHTHKPLLNHTRLQSRTKSEFLINRVHVPLPFPRDLLVALAELPSLRSVLAVLPVVVVHVRAS